SGGGSWDIGRGRVVNVFDEANRRVLRFAPGGGAPTTVPLDVRGTIADLAVAPDGGMTVLETVGDAGQTPLVRRFDATGRSLGATHPAEPSTPPEPPPAAPPFLRSPSRPS